MGITAVPNRVLTKDAEGEAAPYSLWRGTVNICGLCLEPSVILVHDEEDTGAALWRRQRDEVLELQVPPCP